jgi:superfamily II DNA or RNA helicase
MKCRIAGQRIYFVEYSQEEIHWVDQRLTWEGRPETSEVQDAAGQTVKQTTKTYDHLLYTDNGNLFTYYGIYNLLLETAPFPVEIVESDQNTNFQRVQIPNDLLRGIELFDFQVMAVEKCVMLKKGVVESPTGSGKTEMILALLRYLLNENKIKKGLLIVPTVGLADQTLERALLRGFTIDEIGVYHGKEKHLDQPLVIAVVDSIYDGIKYQKEVITDLVQNVNFLGFDECHHLRGNSWLLVGESALRAEYLLGWSGSPFQSRNALDNAGDALIYGFLGRVIFTETYEHLKEIGLIAEPVVHMKNIPGVFAKYMGAFRKIYDKYIVKSETRNEAIIQYTRLFVQHGFPVLILIQRKEHAMDLISRMMDLYPVCIFGGARGVRVVNGGDRPKTLEEYEIDMDTFRMNFENGIHQVAIATQVLDEGIDIPSVGAVIMGGGGKSMIKLTQRLGRGLRRKKVGLNRVYILDFRDCGHVFLHSHSKTRRKFYEEAGALMIDDHYVFTNMMIMHSQMNNG